MRAVKPKNFVIKKQAVEQENLTGVYKAGSYGESPHKNATPADVNLFLVGLRGSGKSTVGRKAAQALGRTFVDTDELIEAKAGTTIAEYVAANGWDAFRQLESQVLEAVCARSGQLVATGGGIVLSQANRDRLESCGKVFYLLASLKTLQARLQADPGADQRPALTNLPANDEMRQMLVERDPLYMQVADFILPAELPVDELVQDMADKVKLLIG